MIYNKPSDIQKCSETAIENRQNPVVLCADMDEYQLYSPIKVKRRRVRCESRRIRRAKRRFSFLSAFFTTAVALFVMVAVMYFSAENALEGENIKTAAADILTKTSENVVKLIDAGKRKVTESASNIKSNKSIPVYLESGVKGEVTQSPQRIIYANGYEPEQASESLSELTSESSGVTNVSSQTKGKSGSDGKVYLPLVDRNLSADNMLLLSNETRLSPDMQSLSQTVPKVYKNLEFSDKPLVLVVHTHATESYTSGTDGTYEKNESTRSDNTNENVVAVGKVLSETLEDFGIPVLHSTTLHDKVSFLNAYTSSLNEVNKILNENPSIRFVIDLHRDAIVSADGEKIAPVTQISGQNYAQLMFVMGTNEAGFNHPDWEDNLCFALDMQKSMDEAFPSIMRPINLRSVSFNEQLSSGYVLLEVGSSGNTLEEAKRSARAFGTVLAAKIIQNTRTI